MWNGVTNAKKLVSIWDDGPVVPIGKSPVWGDGAESFILGEGLL